MSKISEKVEEFLTPIATEMNLEIVEVEFAKKHNGDNLTIFIDKAGGVTINDCEAFHKAIDEPLDSIDPTDGKPYTLNVSSLGIDRPIQTDKDFQRNIGEIIEVHLYEMIGGKKLFIGKLIGFDSLVVILEIQGEEIEFERKKISKATKYIDF